MKSILVYILISFLIQVFSIYNSYQMHSDLFLAIYHQMTKKINKIIMVNFIVSLLLFFYIGIFKFIFNEIKEGEKISLIEKMKYKLLDIILMLFIFDKEKIDQIMVFNFILFLSCLFAHYLTIKRSEYLMQQQQSTFKQNLKIFSFYIFIQFIEILIIINMSPQSTKDIVTKLFWYEFCILYIKGLLPFIKYQVELFERSSLSHLDSKFTFFCIIEFIINVCRIMFFFYYMFYVLNDNKSFRYIHLYQDIIYQISMLKQTISNFYSSVKLTIQLNKLPDVIPEENDDLCVICLSEIEKGKKIQCGHVFHLACLKRWIQGSTNQNCPKCKKAVSCEQNSQQVNQMNQNEYIEMNELMISQIEKEPGYEKSTDSNDQYGAVIHSLPVALEYHRSLKSEVKRLKIDIVKKRLMMSDGGNTGVVDMDQEEYQQNQKYMENMVDMYNQQIGQQQNQNHNYINNEMAENTNKKEEENQLLINKKIENQQSEKKTEIIERPVEQEERRLKILRSFSQKDSQKDKTLALDKQNEEKVQ